MLHRRSAATATATAPTESVMLEVAAAMPEVTVWVLLQATSPLTTAADIDGALGLLAGSDCVVSVVRQRRFRWTTDAAGLGTPAGFDPARRPRRQDHDGMLVENGAVYVTGTAGLLASGCRVNGRVALWEMAEAAYLEVDEPVDLLLVDALLRAR